MNSEILGEGSYQTSPEIIHKSEIFEEGSIQTSSEIIQECEILGGGSYQTPLEIKNNFETLGGRSSLTSSDTLKSHGERSFQISPENPTVPEIKEGSIQTSLERVKSVDCKEGSNQTSICKSTQSLVVKENGRSKISSLKNIKFPRVKMFLENNNTNEETSHITLEELMEKAQKYKIKFINQRNYNNKSKPSSKIINSSKTMSKKIMDRFLEQRKSRYKNNTKNHQMNGNNNDDKGAIRMENALTHDKCLVISEEVKEDRSAENTNSIPFTLEELNEPVLQITEKALVHDPPSINKIQTRSQTGKLRNQEKTLTKYKDEIRPLEERTDPPDKYSNSTEDKEEDEVLEKLNRNNIKIKIKKKNSRVVHPNRLRISHIK